MPAKFTDAALRINGMAQEDARALNHDFIGTEHLLLGLFHDEESIASLALKSLGVSPLVVRQRGEEIDGRGVRGPGAHIPCTPRATSALELSAREARHLGHSTSALNTSCLALSANAKVSPHKCSPTSASI